MTQQGSFDLYLFRDRFTGRYLGIDSTDGMYHLFRMPEDRNAVTYLSWSTDGNRAREWLKWFLGHKTNLNDVSSELHDDLVNETAELEIIKFAPSKTSRRRRP